MSSWNKNNVELSDGGVDLSGTYNNVPNPIRFSQI